MLKAGNVYTRDEMARYFGTSDRQGIRRKLDRYTRYSVSGRGEETLYNIIDIPDPFKLYAIFNMHYSPQTDFDKLAKYLYYLMNDEEFRRWPDNIVAQLMSERGCYVSRQTIGSYKEKLVDGIAVEDTGDDIATYYFSYNGYIRECTREEYRAAWKEFWELYEASGKEWNVMYRIIWKYGGKPIKRKRLVLGAFGGGLLYYELKEVVDNKIEALCGQLPEIPVSETISAIRRNSAPPDDYYATYNYYS